MAKIILLDCDETIWSNADGDYISSLDSDFSLYEGLPHVVVRLNDGAKFVLLPELRATISLTKTKGYRIGIVSDNKYHPVEKALKLTGIWSLLDKSLINIKLWKGHCFKETMVDELINKYNLNRSEVLWLDDKDFQIAADSIDVQFVRVKELADTLHYLKNLI